MSTNLFKKTSKIVVTCPFRMAPNLATEVSNLGYSIYKINKANIETSGSIEDCMLLNLKLRTGHKVLYELMNFTAKDANGIYEKLITFPWELYFYEDGYISIESVTQNDSINDTRFTNLKVKDAIVDRFLVKYNQRPNSGPDRSKAVVFVHWKNDDVAVYIDTSGEPIAKHGYRKIPMKAPLQESLAASIIMSTNWKTDQYFINPMCGSGTLAIEAALMVQNSYPNTLRRNYGFCFLRGFEIEDFYSLREKINNETVSEKLPVKIIATDHDPTAIKAAKTNAEEAGVAHLIDFKCCDYTATKIPEGEGIVILNPEYGSRLGEEEALEETYKGIGDFFKKSCKGKTGYIFTGNLNLSKKVGLKSKKKIEFYNSKIDCRLIEFELYDGSKRKAPL